METKQFLGNCWGLRLKSNPPKHLGMVGQTTHTPLALPGFRKRLYHPSFVESVLYLLHFKMSIGNWWLCWPGWEWVVSIPSTTGLPIALSAICISKYCPIAENIIKTNTVNQFFQPGDAVVPTNAPSSPSHRPFLDSIAASLFEYNWLSW